MDIKRLRVFLAVAETGSFTAAAEQVFLTQSAVSQQMSLIERELRQPLFLRGSRGVTLTGAGTKLAELAGRVLTEMDTLESTMATLATGRLQLKVGAFSSAGVELLPRALRDFRARRPEIDVSLSTMNPEDPLESLMTGTVDLLLAFDYSVGPKQFGPNVERVHLFDDPFQVLVPKNHPLASSSQLDLAELAGESWIFHRHSPPYTDVYEQACALAGFEPDVVFYADEFRTLQGLVAAGMGVSVAPLLSLAPLRGGVAVVPVSTPRVSRRISVLMLRDSSTNSAITGLVSSLRDAAAGAVDPDEPRTAK